MEFVSDVKLPKLVVEKILKSRGLEDHGPVQKAIDKAVIDYNKDYVPWQEGILAVSPETASDIGSGEVVYDTPYAHFQYEDKVMEDPETHSAWARKNVKKQYREPEQIMKHKGGSLRGGHWNDRMKIDHIDDIVKTAQAIIDLGGKK